MGLSLVPLFDAAVRFSYLVAGLRPATLDVDSETTIHYWSPNSSPDEASPVVLLIHGFGPRGSWQWARQVGALASAGYRVIVPDLIFFDNSTTVSERRDEAVHAEAFAKLLDHLGIARFAVVGTSYGGFVAYHLARMLGPEKVAKVVIASSDLLKAEADDRAFLRRLGLDDGRTSVESVLLPTDTAKLRRVLELALVRQPSWMPEFMLSDVVQNLFMEQRDKKIELIKGMTLGKPQFQLTPLSQDVLVIWGEHDQIFPLEKAFLVARGLGEKARLEIVKNTGHGPQMEDAKRFNQIILEFLGIPKHSI